jgi:hypothetical protein
MSKRVLHPSLSAQGGLFDSPIAEGALDVSLSFRDVLSKTLSACKDSRYQVAAKISELTRHNMSKEMLDKYTSSNGDYCFRAEDLAAFCAVVGSLEPFRALLEPLGCEVVGPEDSKLLKLTKKRQERAKMDEEIAPLERETGVKPIR